MTYKEKLRALLDEQKVITDAAAAEGNRDLTDEEQRVFDRCQSCIELLRECTAQEPESQTGAQELNAAEERDRCAEITSLCREFSVDPTAYIQDGASADTVRAAILDTLRTRGAPVNVQITVDEHDKYRSAAADAMLLRAGLEVKNPAAGARDLLGLSIRDLAAECLTRDGTQGAARMSGDELYAALARQFYNPSAAFPSIMDQTVQKSYEAGYNQVQTTFEKWTTRGVLHDFKTTTGNYLIGGAGEFKRVPENGELQHDLPTDAKLPTRKLETYGRQFTMTRQAFINDDIGFLTTIPARYARAARKTINSQVYGILFDNPVIYDGVTLFDASAHGNLIDSGTEVTAEAIQKMMLKMQVMRDPSGDPVIVRPRYLVVPVGYGFTVATLFRSPTIHTADNTQAYNPLYQSAIEVVEDPTLNARAGTGAAPWFLVADQGDAGSIQIDYLNG